MISTQMLRGKGRYFRGLSKRLDDFRNFLVSLIISLFVSKLYNFDPYIIKCKSLSFNTFLILGSRLLMLLRSCNLIVSSYGVARESVMLLLWLSHNHTYS